MYNLNSYSVTNNFIKNLLTETPLPNLPVVAYGDRVVQDVTYLNGYNIIRCTEDGVLRDLTSNYMCSNSATCSDNFICGLGIKSANYTVVGQYTHEGFKPGKTNQFYSKHREYDLDTHKRLGEYLRWYKSTTNINLMGLYNCFYPEATDDVSFALRDKSDGLGLQLHLTNGPSEKFKVYKVPVNFNENYSIFLSAPATVYYMISFIRGGTPVIASPVTNGPGLLHEVFQYRPKRAVLSRNQELVVSTSIANEENEQKWPPALSFTPTPISGRSLFDYRDDLYLLIAVDKSYSGTITILEDTHINLSDRMLISAEIGELAKKDSTGILLDEVLHFEPEINPSILTDDTYTPFSDKLLSYLVENAITSQEDIPLHIKRVQEKVGDTHSTSDVWGELLLSKIYATYSNSKNGSPYDITGYVDKDVEKVLFE